MKFCITLLAASLLGLFAASATPYATYLADLNQQVQNPSAQGWTISTGGLSQGVDDAGTLAWILNDNSSAGGSIHPTMYKDYGAANIPGAGDPWSLTVSAKIVYGNGAADNLIQWSNGTIRYLVFPFADAASGGNIDVQYWNSSGTSTTLQNVAPQDNGYHTWAIVHNGSSAKLTRDGVDVVALGSIAAGTQARGIHIGGGTSGGSGALYITSVSYDATLPPVGVATRFARVFGNHMVLQRNEPVAVFGTDTAAAGQRISVSFAGQTKATTTDATGKWRVTLDPLATSTAGQSLTVTGSATTTLTDVLVGEVWLAAGQSNMNHTVGASSGSPKAANFPLVRMCNWDGSVATGASQVYGAADYANLTPDHYFVGTWQVMDASTVAPQSGVAWYYASELADALRGSGPGGADVPVGVLDCSVGGTSTEAYIPPAVLLADPLLKIPFQMPKSCPALGQWTASRIQQNLGSYTQADLTAPHPHPYAPGFLYQVGIAPILPFTFRGAIWYQGESNAEFTDVQTGTDVSHGRSGKWISDYQTHVMEVLVDSWRTAFGKPDLPFYQVMLPRISAANRVKWPWYREAQQRLDAARDNVETAVITEFGVDGNVHPPNKEAAGARLARIARAKLYGETTLEYSGPRYKRQTISGNKIILEFDHIGGGLVASDGAALRHFEIAGMDRTFVAATATIVGNTVEVSAAGVSSPLAVRFAWTMGPDVNFRNRNGAVDLSAMPFRTDDWMIAGLGRKIRVACIGDSITYGYGINDPANNSYPAQLAKLLGTTNFEVQNFGHSGARVNPVASNRYVNSAAFTAAKAYDPDLVICNLGINDITEWGSYTAAQFRAEYKAIIQGFAASAINDAHYICWHELAPLFPGQTYHGSANLPLLNTLVGDTLSYLGVDRLDMYQPLKDHPEWFLSDKIHPNATGARKIAEETFQYLESHDALDPKPLINEFQSINTHGLQDDDGAYSDWLELSNRGSTGVSLSHHYLTKNMDVPTMWRIPATTVLDPGGRMLVYASAKNRAIAERPLHTNFTLEDGGGSLALIAPDGSTVRHVYNPYPAQFTEESFGISESDRTATIYFPRPSPNDVNGTGTPGGQPYAAWKSHFGVASDDSDADGDGNSALMEFLTGSNPDSGNSAFRPLPHIITAGGEYLGVSCRIAKNLAGASLTLETSDDMGVTTPWTIDVSPVLVSASDNGDGTLTRTYRRNAPISPGTRDFLRVGYHYSE